MTELNWPFTRGRTLDISHAEGRTLYTSKGDAILDAAGGAIVCNVGHGRKRIADAMAEAALKNSFIVPPWITPERRAMVNQLEAHWVPESHHRFHFCSGGSESVESGIKVAHLYQSAIGQKQRHKVISRHVSYHGTTITTAGISGHLARKRGIEQALAPNPVAPTPYMLRHPEGNNQTDARYFIEETRRIIEREGPETIAAFIGEPITGSSGGAIVPPDDYWPGIRALCDDYGIVLIADEVMTGFGRLGTPFGYQNWDYAPDVIVCAKGLSGGYAPLGGVFTRNEIGEAITEAGFNLMFHTFAAHPVACAASAETLKIMHEENLVTRAREMGDILAARLDEAFAGHPHVAEVRGMGLLRAIEIVKDRDSLEPYPEEDGIANRIVIEGLQRGVFYYGGGTGEVRDIVCLGPAFTVTHEEIDRMVDVLRASVDKVTQT